MIQVYLLAAICKVAIGKQEQNTNEIKNDLVELMRCSIVPTTDGLTG